ncbi:hypothetical protein CC80DRAFT_506769 [Byssothecium circinans]|uniref:Uncharacterized protein n=1 Tax=Byssothecium circinans TaxID=147558 RepID=A0A6A5TMK4_9PLEO|nr:hypothetical protein CC80DRAFT_506769 [Byssothecium circinans]
MTSGTELGPEYWIFNKPCITPFDGSAVDRSMGSGDGVALPATYYSKGNTVSASLKFDGKCFPISTVRVNIALRWWHEERVAGQPLIANMLVAEFWGCFVRKKMRSGWAQAKGFVETGAERCVDLLHSLLSYHWILDELVDNDLAPLRVVWVPVLTLSERLEEVVKLLAHTVSLNSMVQELHWYTVLVARKLPHAAVEGDNVRDLVDEMVSVVYRAIESTSSNTILAIIEEAQKSNVGNGVESEEVGPFSVIKLDIFRIDGFSRLQRGGAALIHVLQELFGLVGHLVLPPFEVLEHGRACRQYRRDKSAIQRDVIRPILSTFHRRRGILGLFGSQGVSGGVFVSEVVGEVIM